MNGEMTGFSLPGLQDFW